MNASRKLAFSLLELLVTVAILSVLVALGVSALGKTREKTASIRCMTNLRQIATAFSQSAGENRGVIKFHMNNAAGKPTTLRWIDYLIQGGYLKSTDTAIRCAGVPPNLPTGNGYVYGGIGTVTPTDPHSRMIDGLRASRAISLLTIERPSTYWLLADTWSTQHNNQIYIVEPAAAGIWRVQMRHSNRANVLFADGHVEALDMKAMKDLAINPLSNAFDAKGNPIQ